MLRWLVQQSLRSRWIVLALACLVAPALDNQWFAGRRPENRLSNQPSLNIWRHHGKSATGPCIENCGPIRAGGLRLDSDWSHCQNVSRLLGAPL